MFKNNKVILLVLLIIVAFVGYRFVFKKDSSTGSDLVVETGQEAGNQLPIGRELIETLSKLKSLNLDSSFFKDPIYSSLVDFSVQIIPQEVGRSNPFSPVGGIVKQSQ